VNEIPRYRGIFVFCVEVEGNQKLGASYSTVVFSQLRSGTIPVTRDLHDGRLEALPAVRPSLWSTTMSPATVLIR
jgi:hypothetical protein